MERTFQTASGKHSQQFRALSLPDQFVLVQSLCGQTNPGSRNWKCEAQARAIIFGVADD